MEKKIEGFLKLAIVIGSLLLFSSWALSPNSNQDSQPSVQGATSNFEEPYVNKDHTDSYDYLPDYDTPTFNDYPCTDDCSGHEAGYDWAYDNHITDPDDCGGNSDSFIEGCMSYAEEYQSEVMEDEYYEEDEYDY